MKTNQLLIVNGGKITANDENDDSVEPMLPVQIDGTVPEKMKYSHSFNRQTAEDHIVPMLPAGFHIKDNGNALSNT